MVAFYINVLHFQFLNSWKKIQKPTSVTKETQNLTVHSNVTFFVFSDKFHFKSASSNNFQIFRVLFLKKPCIFFKKSKLCTFWGTLLFQSHSTGNLQHSEYLNTINFSIKKPSLFEKKTKLWKFWEVSLIRSLSNGSLLYLAVYNTSYLFWMNPSFFKKTQLLKVMGRFTNLVAFPKLIATFRVFKKVKFLFGKTNFFSVKKSIYERFENFYYFVAFHDKSASFTDF